MAQRTCDVEGCERPHRAKGLCAYHYRIANPPVKNKAVECPTCGAVTMKRDGDRRFCSLLCRDLWRVEQPADPMYTKLAAGRRPRLCRLPKDHPVITFAQACPLNESECRVCGLHFMHRPSRRRSLCSRRCAERARRMRRDGRLQIKRSVIFERDGYTCWICDTATSPTYTSCDPWSPTIDHLVPIAFGGDDEPENLATAHMICNSTRGASWDISRAA